MRYIKVALCLSIFLSCRSRKVNITPLPMMKEVDTLKHDGIISTYRTDYYLVSGKSTNIQQQISLFISKNLDSNLLKFNQYDMKFFKETKTLNLKILPKYTQKYKAFVGKKPIIIYSWFNGHLISH